MSAVKWDDIVNRFRPLTNCPITMMCLEVKEDGDQFTKSNAKTGKCMPSRITFWRMWKRKDAFCDWSEKLKKRNAISLS